MSTQIGVITIEKVFDDEGRVLVRAHYDGLNVFESIGMLTSELDTQRALLRRWHEEGS